MWLMNLFLGAGSCPCRHFNRFGLATVLTATHSKHEEPE